MLTQMRGFLSQDFHKRQEYAYLLGMFMAMEGPINQTTGGIFYFEMESCLVNNLRPTNPKWGDPFKMASV